MGLLITILSAYGVTNLSWIPYLVAVLDIIVTLFLSAYNLFLLAFTGEGFTNTKFEGFLIWTVMVLNVSLLISSPIMIAGVAKDEPSYLLQWILLEVAHTAVLSTLLLYSLRKDFNRFTLMVLVFWNLGKWLAIAEVIGYYKIMTDNHPPLGYGLTSNDTKGIN